MMGVLKRGACNGRPKCGSEKSGSDQKVPGGRQESGEDPEIEGGWKEGGANWETESGR
jgi:hypothetical protein